SSQSYFQNVFKKKYGCTPKAYRKTGASLHTS
ncbi:MAG: helix-turn-helix transcriptional regulator, partial [Lachnospiraceae bacterium]|nr:helix-turn-helix transcriptional regulator [Lachnospiraceae bacterium]